MIPWRNISGRRFLKDIRHALEDGRHCLAVLPGPEEELERFASEIGIYLDRRIGSVRHVCVDNDASLEETLRGVFAEEDGAESATADLADLSARFPGSSCLVAIFSPALSPENAGRGADTMNRLAGLAKNRAENGEPILWSILAILPAHMPLPKHEVRLDRFFWWNRLRPSDLENALEAGLEPAGLSRGDFWWLRSLCSGIAVADPALVGPVADGHPKTMEDVRAILRGHPLSTLPRNLLDAAIRINAGGIRAHGDTPPAAGDEAALWHAGALAPDCFGRPALHPAVLAAAGQDADVERLVVRGQIREILPLVQDVHQAIWNRLCREHGDLWHRDKHAIWKHDDRNDRHTTFESIEWEIGALPAYFSEHWHVSKEIYQLAHKWREIRHTIAHNQLVPRENLLDAFERLSCLER